MTSVMALAASVKAQIPDSFSTAPPAPAPPGPAADVNPWALAPKHSLAIGAPVPSAPAAMGNAQRSVMVTLEGTPETDYLAKLRTSNGQTFNLVVDTGSSTTAIVSNLCQVGPYPRYNLSSAHLAPQNQPLSTTYGSGSWNATAVFESLTLGDDTTLTMPTTIAAMTQASPTFFQGSNATLWDRTTGPLMHGIMGLAYPALAAGNTSAVASNLVGTAGFTLELCDKGGTMLFGAPDIASLAAHMRYTPVVSEIWYEVPLQAIGVGSQAVNIASDILSHSIIDSGTTLLTLQPEAYTTLQNAIGNHAGYGKYFAEPPDFDSCQYPLQNVTRAQLDAALPRLSLSFVSDSDSDENTTMVDQAATQSYLLPIVTASLEICYVGALRSLADLTPSWEGIPNIVGSAPLRGVAVHYDVWNNRVGFAPGKSC